MKIEERSKENRAIPRVGENLALEGCMVRKDAQGSQFKKAERVIFATREAEKQGRQTSNKAEKQAC